jgi:putative transposase
MKGSSSKWINENNSPNRTFPWWEGYRAFSVSSLPTADVVRYIQNQRTHHEKKSFEDEFVEFLKKYGVTYDPANVLG